jgi:mono/diheme cytochrome c family protein
MKSYIPHISKFISLTLILLILSFGMVVYAYYDYSKPIPISEEPQFYCGVVDLKSEILIDTPEKALGEQIFKNNCSTCHATTDEVVVGPGLKGILERRPINWILKWVNNPQKVIKSGDKYAVGLFEKFNHAEMTPYPNLKRGEILSIIAYIDNK